MPWTSKHLKWLVDTGERLTTSDGKIIPIWEFRHANDEIILSAWAKHFRNHYCFDAEIDPLRSGTKHSRSNYLKNIKFPDASVAPGPSIRSGDFGEILVADYLQYILGYWVPRTHYSNKDVRNESTKGCDIMGFKLLGKGSDVKDACLAIYEAKAQFSGRKANPRLQDAVDGSAKDYVRKAESLNAIKQNLLIRKMAVDAKRVERFQNPEDYPYQEIRGAVALFCSSVFDENTIKTTSTKSHPQAKDLSLLVIRGENMMGLIRQLYERAANEA